MGMWHVDVAVMVMVWLLYLLWHIVHNPSSLSTHESISFYYNNNGGGNYRSACWYYSNSGCIWWIRWHYWDAKRSSSSSSATSIPTAKRSLPSRHWIDSWQNTLLRLWCLRNKIVVVSHRTTKGPADENDDGDSGGDEDSGGEEQKGNWIVAMYHGGTTAM